MELKTLKDFKKKRMELLELFEKKLITGELLLFHLDNLNRAEAIKWIKHFYNPNKTTMEIKEWINFFNITDEELKE